MAPRIGFGLGVDLSREMLAVARANLDRTSLRNCQVRHGDMYHLPLPDGSFDAATLHNVLRFADDPGAALAEAARVLRPGGRLVVVDLAPHRLEVLREQHAHRRLGFADVEIEEWFAAAGLAFEPPVRIQGDPLTVVIWPARRRGAPERDQPAEPGRTADARSHDARAHQPVPSEPAAPDGPPPAVALSFEFFPPKTPAAAERLWQTVEQLKPLGAALRLGDLRRRRQSRRRHRGAGRRAAPARRGLRAAAHLTCASAPRAAIDGDRAALLGRRRAPDRGAARRPPEGRGAPAGGDAPPRSPLDLVRALRRIADFEISVAAYPETHPEAAEPRRRPRQPQAQARCRRGRAITQYCFETETVLRFRDRMAAAGITAPLAVGIMPVHDFAPDQALQRGLRRRRAGLARRAVRGARGRSRRARCGSAPGSPPSRPRG